MLQVPPGVRREYSLVPVPQCPCHVSLCAVVVRAFFIFSGGDFLPSKPMRPCAHPGCRELVRSGYCEKHRPKDSQRRSAPAAAWHRWYSSPEWRDRIRPAQLLREPFCRECAKLADAGGRPELKRVPATDVDHIVPHRGNRALFFDESNLQSLCHACHSRKTQAEMAGKRGDYSR